MQGAKNLHWIYIADAPVFDKAGRLIDAFLSQYDLILTPTGGSLRRRLAL
ncbi:hypothetical protein J4714_14505 [Staphylococcus epidermidis]|nr:hypothetical protein [Staphylococcus epidermidis]